MVQFLLLFDNWALLILRVVLGSILLIHGWRKIKDLKATSQSFSAMGFKPAMFWGTIVALVEFLGGLALIGGLLVQVVAFLVAIQFIVIILKVKRGKGFAGGYEFDLLIIAASLILFTIGGGAFGLDNILGIILY